MDNVVYSMGLAETSVYNFSISVEYDHWFSPLPNINGKRNNAHRCDDPILSMDKAVTAPNIFKFRELTMETKNLNRHQQEPKHMSTNLI